MHPVKVLKTHEMDYKEPSFATMIKSVTVGTQLKPRSVIDVTFIKHSCTTFGSVFCPTTIAQILHVIYPFDLQECLAWSGCDLCLKQSTSGLAVRWGPLPATF